MFHSSVLRLGSHALFGRTCTVLSQGLSRKDRGNVIPPGPSEDPWTVLTNELAVEICRMRRDAKSFAVQERLLTRSDEFLAQNPLRAMHHQDARYQQRTNIIGGALHDVRCLAVDSASFYMRSIIGNNAAAAEEQLRRITQRVMKLTQCPNCYNYGGDDVSQCYGLLLMSASCLCRGIREWELLPHDLLLETCAAEVHKWERHASSCCPETLGASVRACFWHGPNEENLGMQRRWLLTLPLVTVALCSKFGVHDWKNRINLTSLANVLALVRVNPLTSSSSDEVSVRMHRALITAITRDLLLFPLGNWSSSIRQPEATALSPSTTLPRWALGTLSPLLGAPALLRTLWWPAHTASISCPPSLHDKALAPVLSNIVRLGAWMTAVKSVPVAGVASTLVPYSIGANGSSGRAASLVVNPAMRRVFSSARALDNTLVEWSAVTHDIILTIPMMSLTECRDLLWTFHDRSSRSTEGNIVGRQLLETALRVLLLRLVRLVDKAAERGGKTTTRLSALQRRNVEEEVRRFREVYQCTSSILLRWNIADEDVPPAYWAAVKQYLD